MFINICINLQTRNIFIKYLNITKYNCKINLHYIKLFQFIPVEMRPGFDQEK